jgi:hypothetical protein
MKTLDFLALIHVSFNTDIDPIPQSPNMYLDDLDWPFDVHFSHLISPAINVSNPTQLARYAHAVSKPYPHPAFRESLEGVLHPPAVLANHITARNSPTAPFSGLAMDNCDSISFRRIISSILSLQPISHGSHDRGNKSERGWMVVRPGKMVDASIYF